MAKSSRRLIGRLLTYYPEQVRVEGGLAQGQSFQVVVPGLGPHGIEFLPHGIKVGRADHLHAKRRGESLVPEAKVGFLVLLHWVPMSACHGLVSSRMAMKR